MTNQQAISRLKNRDEFLARKIAEVTAEGRDAYWFGQDRESIAIAIACIEYTQAMTDYEQSQSQSE